MDYNSKVVFSGRSLCQITELRKQKLKVERLKRILKRIFKILIVFYNNFSKNLIYIYIYIYMNIYIYIYIYIYMNKPVLISCFGLEWLDFE